MTLTPELRAFAAELAKRVAPHHGQLGHLAGIIERWLAEPAPPLLHHTGQWTEVPGSRKPIAAATATPAPQGKAQTDAFIAELRKQATKIANYEGARDVIIRLLNEAAARLTASRAPFDEGFRAGVEAAAPSYDAITGAVTKGLSRALANHWLRRAELGEISAYVKACDAITAEITAIAPPAPPSGGDDSAEAFVKQYPRSVRPGTLMDDDEPAPPSGGDAPKSKPYCAACAADID